jgi:hypothetical protein
MALTEVQLRREIGRIMRKQGRGEKLTTKEQRILAYGAPAACPNCHSTVRVQR